MMAGAETAVAWTTTVADGLQFEVEATVIGFRFSRRLFAFRGLDYSHVLVITLTVRKSAWRETVELGR